MLVERTAFMDDSDMGGEGPVAILAGWVAPSGVWAEFSDDWKREVLNLGAERLEVFKPKAPDLQNEFNKARLRAALGLIEKYNPLGLIAAVPHAHHKRAFANVTNKKYRDPYYIALNGIVMLLAKHLAEHVADAGPVDFVFDHQPGKSEAIVSNWEALIDTIPIQRRKLLKRSPPQFQDDKEIMPLQAAHLLAWSLRRISSDTAGGKPSFWFPWPASVRYLTWAWMPDQLDAVAQPLSRQTPRQSKRRRGGGWET